MKNTILGIVIAVILFLAGFLTRQCTFKLPEPTVIETRDTLVVTDTMRVTEFVEVWREVRDTMWIDVGDIQIVHDTTYLPLPREYVTYKDSMYTATISGYRPRLEELEVYPKKEIITIQTEKTITVPKIKRFGVGVQAGYGITPAGFQPYLGLGVSYNILAF